MTATTSAAWAGSGRPGAPGRRRHAPGRAGPRPRRAAPRRARRPRPRVSRAAGGAGSPSQTKGRRAPRRAQAAAAISGPIPAGSPQVRTIGARGSTALLPDLDVRIRPELGEPDARRARPARSLRSRAVIAVSAMARRPPTSRSHSIRNTSAPPRVSAVDTSLRSSCASWPAMSAGIWLDGALLAHELAGRQALGHDVEVVAGVDAGVDARRLGQRRLGAPARDQKLGILHDDVALPRRTLLPAAQLEQGDPLGHADRPCDLAGAEALEVARHRPLEIGERDPLDAAAVGGGGRRSSARAPRRRTPRTSGCGRSPRRAPRNRPARPRCGWAGRSRQEGRAGRSRPGPSRARGRARRG